MPKLEDALSEYLDLYAEHKIQDICKKSIKNNIKPFYEKQEEKRYKYKGLVINETKRVSRLFKPEAVDFLEDRGLLPLAVSIKNTLTKHFNLEGAKTNQGKTLRLYAGGVQFLDTSSIAESFDARFSSLDLDSLVSEFKDAFTQEKLSSSKLATAKSQLMDIMIKENIGSLKCDAGTLKIEETFDLDIDKIFNFVAGKKEIFIKELPNSTSCEIMILPDHKKARLPLTMKLGNGSSLQDFLREEPLKESIYIKKSVFNKFLKEGYKSFLFEVEMDPMDFFREQPLSFTKIEELYDSGLLDPREFEQFIEIDDDKEPIPTFEVLTEGSYDKRREMFDNKLIKRAQTFEYNGCTPDPFSHIDMDAFSF